MRAGLLSDPRVIALLRRHFVPCHISALNTPECMTDPRDVETLARYVDEHEDFDGGEREAFILPGGRMLPVFLSLHGARRDGGSIHKTAEGRRSEDVLLLFRRHAEDALQATHGGLPADWEDVWSGSAEVVTAIEREAPRWPRPEPGTSALRVFVRNSYRMYDDLHGCELVVLPAGLPAKLCGELCEPGDVVELGDSLFRDLARAMVPRGQVGTRLADDSISGRLRLRVTRVSNGEARGAVEGEFALEPADRSEVGRRENAACMFASRGKLRGEFVLDRAGGCIEMLRFVADDVEFEWILRFRAGDDESPPWHRVAVELVRADGQ